MIYVALTLYALGTYATSLALFGALTADGGNIEYARAVFKRKIGWLSFLCLIWPAFIAFVILSVLWKAVTE